jgi:serine/threonine protein kinase
MDTHPAASASPVCPRCSAPLPADAPEGLCPRCVAAGNFLTGSFLASPPSGAKTPRRVPEPAEIAEHFPQLEIESVLGRGGMGVVYLAKQKTLERRVALKLLAPERTEDPVFAARFATEAQALARLHHPHIVTVYDFGRAGGYYYLLMEYVDGLSLRQVQQTGRLAAAEALAIVPQICEALQYAHEQGVVHRDIKPENILMDRQGRVKVADFGLARLAASASEAEEADVVMGTPGYMAPEQRTHPERVDHRADIYALGAVFYEMLTGRRPEAPFASPSRQVRIDVRLDEVVLRALENAPEKRWQQASEVKTQVETIARGDAAEATTAAGVDAAKNPRGGMLAMALALACVAGVGGWWLARRSDFPARAHAAEVQEAVKDLSAGETVDLSPHFTPRKVGAKDTSRALETLSGEAVFDGLRFVVAGQITLAGDGLREWSPTEPYPAKVEGIALGDRRFDELHLLHVTYWENPHGEPVATVRLIYTDGTRTEVPLHYGVHVRDWSKRNSEERERLDDPRSKIVKRYLTRNQYQATTRITKTCLLNPIPEKAVRSMELMAAPGLASYSLLAATTAMSDPAREQTLAVPFDQPEEGFKGEMLVRVVDRFTGARIPGGLITVAGNFSGAYVVAEPLRVDGRGETRVRFPWRGRVQTFSLNLTLAQSGRRGPWLSWQRDYPRVAYFMVGDVEKDENGLERLDADLPEWRREMARELLAELGRNAITPTLPNPGGSGPLHDERAFDDLGALAQGTRGAVLFKAAKAQDGGPEGSEYQNLEIRDAGAYEALHGPREAAKRAFLEWVRAQVAPDDAPLPEWTVEKIGRPAAFRPLTESELVPLLGAVAQSLGGKSFMMESSPATEPADIARRAAVDALIEKLRGSALDYLMESTGQVRVGQGKAFGPSVRVYDLLGKRIELLAERGAVEEIRLRRQERTYIRYFIVSMLLDSHKAGGLSETLSTAENGG